MTINHSLDDAPGQENRNIIQESSHNLTRFIFNLSRSTANVFSDPCFLKNHVFGSVSKSDERKHKKNRSSLAKLSSFTKKMIKTSVNRWKRSDTTLRPSTFNKTNCNLSRSRICATSMSFSLVIAKEKAFCNRHSFDCCYSIDSKASVRFHYLFLDNSSQSSDFEFFPSQLNKPDVIHPNIF